MKIGKFVFLTSLISMGICIVSGAINWLIADEIGYPSTNYEENPYIYYWVILSSVFFYIAVGVGILSVIARVKNKKQE
jgi:hypothetical protein